MSQFNINQLATYGQARELAAKLGTFVGGGVLPETDDPKTSGIYRPEWIAGVDINQEPRMRAYGRVYWSLHFRFKNGFQGMNVGLVREKFKSFPNSPQYVLDQLSQEAGPV